MASNHQSLSFQLENDPVEYKSAVYPASPTDLHGMNVAIRSLPVRILVNPILTQTIVGFSYSFNLPSGTAVVLTDITYSSPSFESQLDFKGHAKLPNGQVLGLVCKQFGEAGSSGPRTQLYMNQAVDPSNDICAKPACPLRLCGRCG